MGSLLHRLPWGAAVLALATSFVTIDGGNPMDTLSTHPEALYGPPLPLVHALGIGPSMAVAVQGERAYIIGRGKLRIADVSRPENPRILGELDGLGNTRQVAVAGSVVYVASREDALFVVDVSDPTTPRLLSHYDSVEFATGLCVAGDVLFLALRQFGVEAVDVSNPRQPRHLSVVRTGEAQSVAFCDGYLYAGVWGTSEVVVVDARNAALPVITAKVPLDGYGDGVFVGDGILYAATGHHSRQTPRSVEGDPGFGHGHGLEIFSLEDPAHPRFLARVKFPPFYRIGNDMWSVQVLHGYAFVADTHNGVFVVDVRDPRRPRCIRHRVLPPRPGEKLPDFVGGIGLVPNHIYAAGGSTDLYVLAAPGLAAPVTLQIGRPPAVGESAPSLSQRYRAYAAGGQVHRVRLYGDLALIAAGAAGVQSARQTPQFTFLHRYPTEGFALDVAARDDVAYVAEGAGGLSTWRIAPGGELHPLGRYRPRAQAVRQVVVPGQG
ncbi:MAG: hypothetical protein QHJ73_13870, partial [Armatimonadota bacterium]|nr:hypothetical protein [Armatimonadota bacterium]